MSKTLQERNNETMAYSRLIKEVVGRREGLDVNGDAPIERLLQAASQYPAYEVAPDNGVDAALHQTVGEIDAYIDMLEEVKLLIEQEISARAAHHNEEA